MLLVDAVAEQTAAQVDALLGKGWSRREGKFSQAEASQEPAEEVAATCACGSGIPIQTITVNGQEITLAALPLIFQNFRDAQKPPSTPVTVEMMEMVKIYNGIEPESELAVRHEVERAYQVFWQKHEASHA
jgi:hypothetical protein